MKAGRTLRGLVEEIERAAAAQADYVATVDALTVAARDGEAALSIDGEGTFATNHVANGQIVEYTGLRRDYFDRLLQEGDRLSTPAGPLFDVTVNTLLRSKAGTKEGRRLVRTLDGRARAFLSDGYRPISHYEIMEDVLPVLGEFPGIDWNASSLEVTDSRLYMRMTNTRVQGEVRKGQIVQSFVQVTNSETGQGAFAVTPGYFVLICTNGAVRQDLASRKYHTGARLQEGEGYRFLADETLVARNKATVMEMRDLIRGSLSEDLFNTRILPDLKEAAGVRMEGHPEKSVERLANRFALNQEERGGILRHLVDGGDLSLWGVSNAITRAAQDVASYDRSVELEEIGGRLLVSPKAVVQEVMNAR